MIAVRKGAFRFHKLGWEEFNPSGWLHASYGSKARIFKEFGGGCNWSRWPPTGLGASVEVAVRVQVSTKVGGVERASPDERAYRHGTQWAIVCRTDCGVAFGKWVADCTACANIIEMDNNGIHAHKAEDGFNYKNKLQDSKTDRPTLNSRPETLRLSSLAVNCNFLY